MTTLYDRLASIAAAKEHLGYLSHFQDDLRVHDYGTLADATDGQRFIWILRECGTELFPVAHGLDPVWATYWLGEGNLRAVPSLTFLVTVGRNGDGTVAPISYDRARSLARVPHPKGERVTISLFRAA